MKALALALLFSAVALRAVEPSGEALLSEAIMRPGGYNQMCSLPPPVPIDVPLPLYGLAAPRNFNLSGLVSKRLLEHRAEVVAALVRRLDAMDLAQPLPKPKPATGPMDSGLDAARLSGVVLDIISELKAVEALSAMLKIEAQLQSIVDRAVKDSAAPVPDLEVDGINYPQSLDLYDRVGTKVIKMVKKANAPELERERALLRCRVFQRELLSTMAKLLREAGFQPFLTSSIEQAYGDAVKKAAEKLPYKKPSDIPENERFYTSWDERYTVPVIGRTHGTLPFTPELRAQIRGLVTQYLATQAQK